METKSIVSLGAKLAILLAAMTYPKGFTSIGDYCIVENQYYWRGTVMILG
jgi:hypothetical protein